MTELMTDAVETAVLARLLVRSKRPPSETAVLKSLRPLFGGLDPSLVDRHLRTALSALAARGLRDAETMVLTQAGKEKAASLLGFDHRRAPTRWGELKTALVRLALGTTAAAARGPLTASKIRAAALASKLGLETTSTSPSSVLDAWAAREIGMDGGRLTVANVRAHVLSRALGIAPLRDPKRIGAVATAHVLGIPRPDASAVRDAVLRGWFSDKRRTASSNGETRDRVRSPEPLSLAAFAAAVKEVAREATDGRFGRHKVFIAPVWERGRRHPMLASIQERDFKSKLIEAHQADLLRLSRADLTPAMDPNVVRDSEIAYLNAVFHFVDLEGIFS